jgi:outer membrane protein OmpA-like peptidoglycan-associated protein
VGEGVGATDGTEEWRIQVCMTGDDGKIPHHAGKGYLNGEIMMKWMYILLLSLPLMGNAFSQEADAEGCKDFPLITRMPNFLITECSQNFDKHMFRNKTGDEESIEGNITYIAFRFNAESEKTFPSVFQIIKNYENVILKLGGKKVFVNDEVACYTLPRKDKTYNIMLESFGNTGTNEIYYRFYAVEMVSMTQEVTTNDMLDALNKDGFIALDIQFASGKSTILEESQPLIENIYVLLKTNPDYAISIEGHTDNVGKPDANKKLSEARAKAIKDALVAKGIDASRLSSVGWGQEKPVADNRSDEGKARNRRVEIVKK